MSELHSSQTLVKWRVLILLSFAELLGMSLWFSASASVPALAVEWNLNGADQAWLTMMVQFGFVAGTLTSALLTLPDVFSAKRVFVVSCVLGAAANAAIGLYAHDLTSTLILRFVTGVFLAGVYPPAMKIMASWFKVGRGMAIGVLVGALTIGSASPHLINAVGATGEAGSGDPIGVPMWRSLMLLTSALALIAAIICALFVSDGPYHGGRSRFDWGFALRSMRDRGMRLANLGYLGHQWELYAMWTWLPIFLFHSYSASGGDDPSSWSSRAAFGCIGIGGVACVVAGVAADRFGRTVITMLSLLISGSCCLIVGQLYGGPPWVLLAVCTLWGFAIIADSAQYSASVSELAEPEYVGTALTLQTCLGFLLTLGSIRLIPILVDWFTWTWAFAFLTPGPVLGLLSMYRLRQMPEASRLGGERR